jgi:hypothetical protein
MLAKTLHIRFKKDYGIYRTNEITQLTLNKFNEKEPTKSEYNLWATPTEVEHLTPIKLCELADTIEVISVVN